LISKDLSELKLINADKPLGVELMAAPIGNRNAQKGKVFFDALRKAMAEDDHLRVRKAANKLLDLAAEGEHWAIKELADRLDGKSSQENFIESRSDGALLCGVQVTFVNPETKSMAA
jgi:hypothetical protein